MARTQLSVLRRSYFGLPAIALALLGSSPALAGIGPDSGGGDGCNPGRANNYLYYYFDGAYQDAPGGQQTGGNYASIYNYSPYVNGVDSNDTSSAWVMVVNTTYYDYSRAGWIEYVGGKRYTFAEWGYDNGQDGFTEKDHAADTINNIDTYKVTYNPTTNYSRYYINATEFDSAAVGEIDPNENQTYGEIHTFASQMPGGSSNRENFTGSHIWYPAGQTGSWQNSRLTADNTSGVNPATYYGNVTGATSVSIWDKGCTN